MPIKQTRFSRFKAVLCCVIAAVAGIISAPYAETVEVNRQMKKSEHVILVHGMCRSAGTMESMAKTLRKAGYTTTILDYPSRKKTVRKLSDEHLAPAVEMSKKQGAAKIHFVTHSLGGILVRDYLARRSLPELGRVVMLAPPNQGSEVVDRLGHWKAFKVINGPAGRQLGTREGSVPVALGALGAVHYSVGVIAGDRTINPINSCMIPGSDDGKVSVENTKLEGMADHVVLHCTHPMIMKRPDAIRQTLHFLQQGKFDKVAN